MKLYFKILGVAILIGAVGVLGYSMYKFAFQILFFQPKKSYIYLPLIIPSFMVAQFVFYALKGRYTQESFSIGANRSVLVVNLLIWLLFIIIPLAIAGSLLRDYYKAKQPIQWDETVINEIKCSLSTKYEDERIHYKFTANAANSSNPFSIYEKFYIQMLDEDGFLVLEMLLPENTSNPSGNLYEGGKFISNGKDWCSLALYKKIVKWNVYQRR